MRCLHPPLFCCIGCAEILSSPVLPGLCARQERPAGREKSLLFPAETGRCAGFPGKAVAIAAADSSGKRPRTPRPAAGEGRTAVPEYAYDGMN